MGNSPSQDSSRSGTHMISADDAEYPREYRTLGNGTRRFSNVGLVHTSERRHTVIAAQSLEALTNLQKSDMERKRDAFMDHLKNKYPQHALTIRGQQERIRDQLLQGSSSILLAGTSCSPDALMYRETQENAVPVCLDNPSSQPNYWSFKTRSSRHSQSSQPGLADQAAKLSFASAESLETMSEAELPLGFNRMNRFRQSLPLSRSTSQTKLRSPGVLFLQYGDETRRVHITHEITSMDTLHALIVHMFQQKLTMGMLKSHNTAILIKDESRNVFYELEDVRDIQDRSIIKIYRKEPIYSSFPAPHITNGDVRREMMYGSRDSSPTRRLNSMSPAPHMASGSPPPVLQSSSPARSRMSYSGGRPPSYAGSPVHHSDRMSGLPPAQGVSPSPSAILERRDVKPDEDLTNKNVVLVKNEGLYSDPYAMVHEGRLSITSTQSLAGLGDPFAYPGGLYKRGSVRSLSTYSAAALQTDLEDGMYKPNSQIYGDTYGPGMGFRLPPSSPQKVSDGRMVEVNQSQGPHSPYSGPSSRSSPVRQTFRKDSSSSVFMDSPVGKQRNPSSSSGNNEIFPGPGERPLSGFSSPVPTKEVETRERMEAMEKQIASLTGLVQSALMQSSHSENPSEKSESTSCGSTTLISNAPEMKQYKQSVTARHPRKKAEKALTGPQNSSTPMSTPTPGSTSTPADQSKAISRLHMQLHLHDLQHNASELRNQLQQLKKLQLQNQETVRSMLKRTETEISVRVTDTVRKHEDPLQRQRAMVEEERLKYLNEEELITQQLNDLEKSVDKIKKDLAHNHRLISVQELEEKAVVLKQLGETLTELKAQFPSLQSKMRIVLRVEVEAVKFLKEEPHRLDGLLKRCKTVTDTLAQIRKCPLMFSRQVDEGVWNTPVNFHNPSPKQMATDGEFSKSTDFELPCSPPTNFSQLNESQTPNWEPVCHSDAASHTSTPTRGEMVTVKTQTVPETQNKKVGAEKSVSVEAAERDWEEKRAALTQYSAKDINRLLEETQAELMKAIPDLDFAAKHKSSGSAASTPEHRVNKTQQAQKLSTKLDPNGRRGSDELTVPRYRTEKPSKSPPPPPPRRSFPSSHGITTTRTGEVIVTSKKDAAFIKKSDSEELEIQKPQVKLRRTVSEVVRPASTPPIIASGIKDDDDEDRIIAELEVFQRSSGSLLIPQFHSELSAASHSVPRPAHLWSNEATIEHGGWKAGDTFPNDDTVKPPSVESTVSRSAQIQELSCPPVTSRKLSLPQIILTEWSSNPPSPPDENYEINYCCFANLVSSDGLLEKVTDWSCSAVVKDKVSTIEDTGLSENDNVDESDCTNMPDECFKHTEHDSVGFMIRNNRIVSLSTEEKNKLLEVKHFCEIKKQVLTKDNDSAQSKTSPVSFLSDEGQSPQEAHRELWNVKTGVMEMKEHEKQIKKQMGNTNYRESTDQSPSFNDFDGQIEMGTSDKHPNISKPSLPVPKPRHVQSKASKPQTIKSSDVAKQINTEVSPIQSDGNSKLRVIDVQKMLNSAANTESSAPHVVEESASVNHEAWKSMDICKNTYKRLDSLEESIRELELTINAIGVYAVNEHDVPPEHRLHAEIKSRKEQERLSGHLNGGSSNAKPITGLDSPFLQKMKPPLLPKPQIAKSGGMSIPPMKMVNPVGSRLKSVQQSSGDKSNKHSKQRMEYMRIQGHQQAARPSKEAGSVNENNPGSDKNAPSRTSIPVLTSFGSRNSSISF
ncbi:SRC kinase signaling inhibitor 1 isoform X4 [Dendrobates tinctorius]|uniref:SRC kinase signaling inhibitor 1 isoform X4 n=1 Tax=Dendrobates tinctorius TaxID=92724 RepID=UPI003CCA102F